MGPRVSFGYEYGTLTWESFHYHQAAFRDDSQERWAYSTLQFRVLLQPRGVRPLVTFGFGSYYLGSSFRSVETDTAGAQTHYGSRSVQGGAGANLGFGVTWGQGPTRPDVEIRYHESHHIHWLTLAAGIAYP